MVSVKDNQKISGYLLQRCSFDCFWFFSQELSVKLNNAMRYIHTALHAAVWSLIKMGGG